jgi:hypothetical protein
MAFRTEPAAAPLKKQKETGRGGAIPIDRQPLTQIFHTPHETESHCRGRREESFRKYTNKHRTPHVVPYRACEISGLTGFRTKKAAAVHFLQVTKG